MEKLLNYSDIYLVPKYSELSSRSQADISVEFLGRKFAAPFLPANMESVISEDICKWLSFNNYPYIYHRFGDTRKFIQRARAESWPFVSISVGVKGADRELISDIAETKCRVHWVTIDIAHGDSLLTKMMIEFIKEKLPEVKIIAGNVATPEGVRNLAKWGADAAKVGIAGGGACSTKNMTGFHIPMFTCIKDCDNYGGHLGYPNQVSSNIPIIADGGIRENGDFAKALVAGGNLVMAGSVFAACIDAPGETINKWEKSSYYECPQGDKFANKILENGIHLKQTFKKTVFKRYYGSASAKQKGSKSHVEGFELELPCNGMTYAECYKQITESLQSSISYSGGKDLSVFKRVEYVVVK